MKNGQVFFFPFVSMENQISNAPGVLDASLGHLSIASRMRIPNFNVKLMSSAAGGWHAVDADTNRADGPDEEILCACIVPVHPSFQPC